MVLEGKPFFYVIGCPLFWTGSDQKHQGLRVINISPNNALHARLIRCWVEKSLGIAVALSVGLSDKGEPAVRLGCKPRFRLTVCGRLSKRCGDGCGVGSSMGALENLGQRCFLGAESKFQQLC